MKEYLVKAKSGGRGAQPTQRIQADDPPSL